MRFQGIHVVRHTDALEKSSTFLGISTPELILVSGVCFFISSTLKGVSVEILYGVIGSASASLFLLFYLKNKYLPKGAILFVFRKFLIIGKRTISPPTKL